MRYVSAIFHYPIKGLTAQRLRVAAISPGEPLAYDRVFALTRPGAAINADHPAWAKKGHFMMLMLDEGLARVQTRLDVATLGLAVEERGVPVLEVNLADASGRERAEDLFASLVPKTGSRPRLVRSTRGHFMDKPDNVISLINLATVRSLETRWGQPLDPLRFRANFYIEGIRPWEEFGWIGRQIRLGDALFQVDRRNGRCGATNVNPVTAQRDFDVPLALRRDFGHKDLGIYLIAQTGGEVAVGASVEITDEVERVAEPADGGYPATMAVVAPDAAARQLSGAQKLICRGCYLVYDETSGLPHIGIAAGTRFNDLPPDWRCPDCGAEKTTFHPWRAALG